MITRSYNSYFLLLLCNELTIFGTGIFFPASKEASLGCEGGAKKTIILEKVPLENSKNPKIHYRTSIGRLVERDSKTVQKSVKIGICATLNKILVSRMFRRVKSFQNQNVQRDNGVLVSL
jgi:hypothetical protein